ncbi:MAG: hypothetical protein WCO85_02220 [Actinomycetes bacterium]
MYIRKLGALCFVVIISSLALTSCSGPSRLYAVDKTDGVYFSVPKNWIRVSNAALNAREGQGATGTALDRLYAVKWQEAFSPSKKITSSHVLSLVAPTVPLAYIRVRSLLPEEIDAVSYNSLRNMIVPVTSWASGLDATAPEFQLLDDAESIQKIARGVHTVFEFTPKKGVSQTIDQTALVSDDRSTIYVLIVRCTSTCFSKNLKVIDEIVSSFTVRGKR